MQARPDPSIGSLPPLGPNIASLATHSDSVVIVPLRQTDTPLPTDQLAPARGMIIGLLAGAILWAALLTTAWLVFR